MKKHFYFLLFLFLSFISTLTAQSGERLLERGNYTAAFQVFTKALSEAKADDDRIKPWFSLSKIYLQPTFEQRNVDSAYNLAQRTITKFNKLKFEDRERLQKREDLTITILNKWKDTVIDTAFAEASASNTLASYQHFLTFFKLKEAKFTKYKEYASKKRAALLKKDIEQLSDFAAADAFLKTYGNDLKAMDVEGYVVLQKKHLQSYIKENGWAKIGDFVKQNPTNIFIKDTSYASFERVRTSRDLKKFQDFIQKHPSSLFKDFLQDSVGVYSYAFIQKSNNLRELTDFIHDYQSVVQPKILDERLEKLFSEMPAASLLENAFKDNKWTLGDFPLTEKVAYDMYASDGRLMYLTRFKVSFGTFSDTARFRKDLDIAKALSESLLLDDQNTVDKTQLEEIIAKAAPRYTAFYCLQRLIEADLKAKRWNKALETVEKMETYFGASDKRIKELLLVLRFPMRDVAIESFGDSINTKAYREYCPVVTADGNMLYFCRNTSLLTPAEDIFFSQKRNGKWQHAQPVKEINDAGNEAPLSISGDGTRLLLFKNGKLGYADKDATKGWVNSNTISPNINAFAWQGEATISANGQVIIFEARRPDMIGVNNDEQNIDFFISFKQADDSWSEARNIGKDINTFWAERSPFLHPDMKTFYFCSAGRGALGGMDVYKTTRLDETWLHWSEPQPLGKEISTVGDDWGYKISTDGSTAFFSSQGDLYRANPLPKEMRPLPVSTIAGRLVSSDGKPIGDARIVIENLKTGQKVAELRPDPSTGDYFATFPTDEPYGATVVKEGYYPVATHTNIDGRSKRNDAKEDLVMVKISEMTNGNVALPLRNLFFDTDKFDIRAESFTELNRLAAFLKQQKINIEISGHTDNVGTSERNKTLSANRAKAVKTYLLGQGCTETQLQTNGFGETKPVAPNDTDDNKAKNRRVEIRVVK